MKRLLIDVNSIVPYIMTGSTSGIGRTTMELISALSKLDNLPFELILYTQNMKGVSPKGSIPLPCFHLYLPNRHNINNIRNFLRIQSLATNYDLLHIPHNTDYVENLGKTIFTIHDLIVYRYPEMWNVTEKEKNYFKKVAKESKAIITCSNSSKQDIIHFWSVPEEKVTTIPWGINRDIFRPIYDKRVVQNLGINGSYYFCSACNHPRKNLSMILEAYRLYLQRGGNMLLVLLNPSSNELTSYNDLIGQNKIIICRNITDTVLSILYSHAHASIVASSFEGFGLPVLESLACMTQVLTAHNSSLIEAGGKVVDYYSELNAECICNKLLKYDKIKKDNTINDYLLQKHLDSFSWKQCAERYVELYEKLLSR